MTIRLYTAVALLAALTAAPAWAQQTPRRTGPEIATATVGVSAASVGNLRTGDVIDDAIANLNPTVVSGYVTDITGGLRFQPWRKSFALTINANSAARRYESEDRFAVLGHSVGTSVGGRLGRRTFVMAHGSWSYVPSYHLDSGLGPALLPAAGSLDTPALGADAEAFTAAGSNSASVDALAQSGTAAGDLPLAATDFAIGRTATSIAGGGFGITHNLGRRLSVTFSSAGGVQEARDSSQPVQTTVAMNGSLHLGLTRHASLRLGYGRRIAETQLATGTRRTEIDDIDAGIDYQRSFAVSLSRALTFSFGSGSALISDGTGTQATVTGHATLAQQLGRRGEMSLTFSRGVAVQEGIWEPVLSNTIGAQAAVRATPRLAFQATAAATSADAAAARRLAASSAREYYRYSGGAQALFMLTTRGRLFAQYQLYSHSIGADVEMLDGIPREAFRHSVRVGLSWSLPLVTGRLERN